MHGTILFPDLDTLAEFLRSFTGGTATFEVVQIRPDLWRLTFTGGC